MQTLQTYLELHKNDEIHFSEIVNILKQYDEETFSQAIKLIPKDILGDVALELPDRYFDDMVETFEAKDLVEAVKELESDDQVDFMQELKEHDEAMASEVFDSLDKMTKKRLPYFSLMLKMKLVLTCRWRFLQPRKKRLLKKS